MSQILIVDDSSDLLNVLSWSLKRKGYTCDTACYREGIFSKLSEFTPLLIIMDVNLNEEDGRKICMEIKQNSRTRHIPILLFSGMHDLLRDFRSWLADDFIEKPFEMSNIIKKIENLVRR